MSSLNLFSVTRNLLLSVSLFFGQNERLCHSPPSDTIAGLSAYPEETRRWVCENLDCQIEDLTFKSSTIYATAFMPQGKKFIKIHLNDGAVREQLGGKYLQDYCRVIVGEEVISIPPFQCLIQPYIAEINEPGGMLYDYFYLSTELLIPLLEENIRHMKNLVFSTLHIGTASTPNDRLYWDRIGEDQTASTRHILRLYENSKLLNLDWDELISSHFVIDGRKCFKTLKDLLVLAKNTLSPDTRRPLAICHGDWHDMNICVCGGQSFFLDCELAGENDPIGDAAVFLVYLIMQGDYLGPKYHPSHFPHRTEALTRVHIERSPVEWMIENGQISFKNFSSFGVSPYRKLAAELFVNSYFFPLIDAMQEQGMTLEVIVERVRSALFMRFLCVYDLSKMAIDDQVRILAFLATCLCSEDLNILGILLEHL